jgi:hypothetical protein
MTYLPAPDACRDGPFCERMRSMTSEELAAGLARSAEARASALPSAAALMAAFGNTAALATARAHEMTRQQEEDERQRRWFFADARDRGVSDEDAEKILALAFSDDVRFDRSFGSPYDFAHAVLRTVEPSDDCRPALRPREDEA